MLWLTLRHLKSSDEYLRIKAVMELGKLPAEKAVSYLTPMLSDPSLDVRSMTVKTLGNLADRSAIESHC
ncbi:MAG TPA: HEAT repeat domain-containing protein [Blastocatellia bacterium]|nr:HEAT repeat domain-containing protein [Blastocatellia bacterium]